jgi:hypothetical protein
VPALTVAVSVVAVVQGQLVLTRTQP